MENIKISIIIPVYNVAPYLRECLESLVNQTLPDLEFICINDGSIDNSLEILNEYAVRDNRFVVVSQENQGPGIARNKGINIARGECLAFVDPDDYVDLNAFEILYNKFKETGADIVHFDYAIFKDGENRDKHDIISFNAEAKKALKTELVDGSVYNWRKIKKFDFTGITLFVWNRLYGAKFIKDNNLKFASSKHGEDHIFAIGSTLLADKILYLKYPFYFYRQREGSSLHSVSDNNFCVFENVKLLKEFLIKNGLYEELEKEFNCYASTAMAWSYIAIPPESLERYMSECAKMLNKRYYKKFLNLIEGHFSFIENIFSVKNKIVARQKIKFIRILGHSFVIGKGEK